MSELLKHLYYNRKNIFSTKRLIQAILVATWLAMLIATYSFAVIYATTPGARGHSPADWPEKSVLVRDSSRPTLITFIHPKCSCSRATLNELNKIVSHCPDRLKVYILMLVPRGEGKDWAKTDLLDSARAIPGAEVRFDMEGQEANRFHSLTSGHTLVYLPSGELVFNGGITASRGHEGDNKGQSTIEDIARGRSEKLWFNQVFGCPLKER